MFDRQIPARGRRAAATYAMTDIRAHRNVPGVDHFDRLVPRNLRQCGPTPVQKLISERVRATKLMTSAWERSVDRDQCGQSHAGA
jgi:hypothetical protein